MRLRNRGITNNEDLIWGQVQKFHTVQEYGSYAVLWASGANSMLYLYDAFTGAHMANVTSAPAAPMLSTRTGIVDSWDKYSYGSILRWYTNSSHLIFWNSSRLFSSSASGQVNWTVGIQTAINMTAKYGTTFPTGLSGIDISDLTTGDGTLLFRSAPTLVTEVAAGYQVAAALNIKTLELMWGPLNQSIPLYQDVTMIAQGDGYYVLHNKDTNEAYGYSLTIGDKLWGPVKLQGNAFSYLSRGAEIAYGQVYIWDFGGFVTALDLKTGKINWEFTRGSAGYQNPYGIWPIWHFGSQSIADGILFLSESRMYDPPMSPGYHRLAINCTDGTLVWKIESFAGRAPGAIADGMMVQWNSYDKQLDVFGQGQTATTVTVAPKFSVNGESVLVEGMVTDESPGTKNADRIARFPNGVPAVSDDSEEDFMEYVYMQQVMPTNTTGVEVVLSVKDPNNNTYEVGRATSDANGIYQMTFVPEVAGEYTLIATFAGSKAYYGSSAQSAFVVNEAPAPPAQQPEQPPSMTDTYVTYSAISIIVAIAIVGAVLALLVRKR